MWPRNRYTGQRGGLYTGYGGGLYTGQGGGLYTGADPKPFMSNWPPPQILISELRKLGLNDIVEYMLVQGFLDDC